MCLSNTVTKCSNALWEEINWRITCKHYKTGKWEGNFGIIAFRISTHRSISEVLKR